MPVAAASKRKHKAAKCAFDSFLFANFRSFRLGSSPAFQFNAAPYRLARPCFVVSFCPVFVPKWSQSNPSGKNSVQGVDSRRLCIRHNFSLFAAQSIVRRQSGHFHSRLPGSSLVTTIGKSEPNCASAKLGNFRGLESSPEGTAGFQSINASDERAGIPHRP